MSLGTLEMQVNDLANLAQILGRIFEEVQQVSGKNPQDNFIMNFQTYQMLSFLVGELCGRTIRLDGDLESILEQAKSAKAA